MSGTFTKSILKVGSYHSPDGVVDVTPERLKHWEAGLDRLRSVGYEIPSHFDHSNEIDLLEPIAMDVLKRQQDRSARATVGRLETFKVAPDGKSAELTIQTLTPTAREVVEHNAVFVSPVIFPEWKDGQGNVYRDVITSFDLVDHPVDSSQSSFVPALRMGINTKPFLLSVADMADENKDDSKKPDGEGDGAPVENTSTLKDVLDALSKMQIVLPDDTSPENFLDRLHTALLTAAAQNGVEDVGGADKPLDQSNPLIQTMSVRIKQLEETQLNGHRDRVNTQLQTALKEGRCTPAEVDKHKRVLGAVKLSLGSDGKANKTSVEEFLEARAEVPKGTFWTDEQRTQSAQRMSVAEAPESWETTGALSRQLSEKQIEESVAALRRKK